MKKIVSLTLFILAFITSFIVNAEIKEGVARAQFTTAVVNKEPVDNISTLKNNVNKIYFFTEIRGMKNTPVTHRWEYEGKLMAELIFEIGGDRWRIKSSKKLVPKWLGEWKVLVIDWAGDVIAEKTFNYINTPGN